MGVTVVACALGACGTPRPDLARLYRTEAARADQPPVIVIPGLLGTRLVDPATGEEVWPGRLFSLFDRSHAGLALPVPGSPIATRDLVPGGITDRAAGRDFYGNILEVLSQSGGYVPGEPGTRVTDARPRLYVFTYDWRRDNVETARRLDDFIEAIRRDHRRPDLRVDVVAHSMGGLITRYYARYGTSDVLDSNEFPVDLAGEAKLRRVALLGTPNLGSAEALHSFIEGFRVGPGRVATEYVATMPSAYQLFPHAITQWIVTSDGKELARDQFERDIWRRFGWSIFDDRVRVRIEAAIADPEHAAKHLSALEAAFDRYIERARRFTWSLTVPTPGSELRFAAFGGDCDMTPARLVVEEHQGDSVVRLRPRDLAARHEHLDYEALMLEPGDGTVTKASLLGRHVLDPRIPRHRYANVELGRYVFLCESHSQLTGNITFQDNLLDYLLSADPGR